MARYIPGGQTEVIAMQYREGMSELDVVNLFDWIHGTDSSTIYGAVAGTIMQEIADNGGIRVPFKDEVTEVYIPNKALAIVGDWIIRHDHLNFTVMSNAVFQDLYYVKAH